METIKYSLLDIIYSVTDTDKKEKKNADFKLNYIELQSGDFINIQ